MAIGNTDTSSISGVPLTCSARASRRWVRFSNTMSSAIRNSMMPPAMRNESSSMCSAASSRSPNSANTSRITPAMTHARTAIDRFCCGVAPVVSPA
jgi:hypothetical protein